MGMFVTLLYGVLDCSSGSFSYARAGHPYPVLLETDSQPVNLPARTGQIIGVLEEPVIDEGSLVLRDGSTLCLYTDGLSEAQIGPEGQQLEVEGIIQALAGWPGVGAQELCGRLWRMVQERGTADQQDDFTVVIVKKRAA